MTKKSYEQKTIDKVWGKKFEKTFCFPVKTCFLEQYFRCYFLCVDWVEYLSKRSFEVFILNLWDCSLRLCDFFLTKISRRNFLRQIWILSVIKSIVDSFLSSMLSSSSRVCKRVKGLRRKEKNLENVNAETK